MAPLEKHELDMDYIQQGEHVSGLDWNAVEHWKLDGEFLLDCRPSNVIRVWNLSTIGETAVGTRYVSGGLAGNGSLPSLVVPAGSSASLFCQTSNTTAYAFVVDTGYDVDGKLRSGHWLGIISRVKVGKEYLWQISSTTHLGIEHPPAVGAASRASSPSGCVPSVSVNLKTGVVRTLNKVWVNDQYSINVPTQKQLTALIAHELGQVVAASLESRWRLLEELHANSFDSIMKFDGNLLLLFSKFGSLGRTTIESIVEFAGSDMGLKDAASLWLASRYGDRLSMSGLEDLIRSIDKEFLTIRVHTTRFVQGSCRRNVTIQDMDRGVRAEGYCSSRIAVKPKDYNAAMRIIRNAYEWDWFPSMGNVWDAIPLSFVVDWFVNVGDIYKSLDRMVAARYYDVAAILNTVKVIAHTSRCPEVEFQYYDREVSKSLHLSVESVKLGLPSAVNWINGGALLIGFS